MDNLVEYFDQNMEFAVVGGIDSQQVLPRDPIELIRRDCLFHRIWLFVALFAEGEGSGRSNVSYGIFRNFKYISC